MSALERISQSDFGLFLKINRTWTSNFFDGFFWLIHEYVVRVASYLFPLIFIWLNFGIKGLCCAFALICSVSLYDNTHHQLIKEYFARLKRRHYPEMVNEVRCYAKYCPYYSSFTSSNATRWQYISGWLTLFFTCSALFAYAPVFIGVHFRLDALSSVLLGYLPGYIMYRFFNRFARLINNPLKIH